MLKGKKKTNLKKGLYLQIYESVYSSEKGYGVHRSYKPLGYYDDLVKQGIEDPIAYYKSEIDKMNLEVKKKKASDKMDNLEEMDKIGRASCRERVSSPV